MFQLIDASKIMIWTFESILKFKTCTYIKFQRVMFVCLRNMTSLVYITSEVRKLLTSRSGSPQE
jgi:hypothetical protein